jgi:hypothetical protein
VNSDRDAFNHIDRRAQAEGRSAQRTDTPTGVFSPFYSETGPTTPLAADPPRRRDAERVALLVDGPRRAPGPRRDLLIGHRAAQR